MFILKKLILPIGLIFALVVSILYPAPGVYVKAHKGVEISIVLIFLINGYIHRFGEISFNRKFFMLIVLAIPVNLFFMPFLGAFVAKMFLQMSFALGLIVISAVPPTLSSGVVVTEIAEGNSVLAIILTIVLNIFGLVTIPLILKYILAESENISINPLGLTIKLIFIIPVPFMAGRLLKTGFKNFDLRLFNEIIKLLPPFCIVFAVWACMSAFSDFMMLFNIKTISYIVVIAVLIHISFLIFSYLVAFAAKVEKENLEAFIFVSSQKTILLSVLILASISTDIIHALIAILIYYFMQVMLDSVIASLISKRKRRAALVNV